MVDRSRHERQKLRKTPNFFVDKNFLYIIKVRNQQEVGKDRIISNFSVKIFTKKATVALVKGWKGPKIPKMGEYGEGSIGIICLKSSPSHIP